MNIKKHARADSRIIARPRSSILILTIIAILGLAMSIAVPAHTALADTTNPTNTPIPTAHNAQQTPAASTSEESPETQTSSDSAGEHSLIVGEHYPHMTINGADWANVHRGEVFTYTITQRVPVFAFSLTLSNTLEDVLDIVTVTVDNERVELTREGQKIQANLGISTVVLWGKDIHVTVTAKLKDNVTEADLLERYGTVVVPNQAITTINNEAIYGNTVFAAFPTEPWQKPTMNVNGKEHFDVELRDEVILYTIKQRVPAFVDFLVIETQVDDTLEVFEISTNDSRVHAECTDNVVQARLDMPETGRLWGRDIEVSISARLKDDVSESDIIKRHGSLIIPTQAQTYIDGSLFDSSNAAHVDFSLVDFPDKEVLQVGTPEDVVTPSDRPHDVRDNENGATPDETSRDAPGLASTGENLGVFIAVAALLVALGAGCLAIYRRRKDENRE